MIVNYASDAAGAERVVAEIGRGDGRAIAVQADVSSAADVQRLFSADRAGAAIGQDLDGVVDHLRA